jgi:hypothetical protein
MFKFIEWRHILSNGRKCRSAALRGKPFCFHHAKLHFRSSFTRKPGKLAEVGVNDLSSLQSAVAEALRALSSPLTDIRRAGVLLYGLHLAADLAKRASKPQPRERADDRNQLKESNPPEQGNCSLIYSPRNEQPPSGP